MKKKYLSCALIIERHLAFIYPDLDSKKLAKELMELAGLNKKCKRAKPYKNLWNESDIVTISYGDSIFHDQEKPLHTLHRFLKQQFSGIINSVHILPFYPWSSDDGFAVIDYCSVNPPLGNWEDIEAITKDFKLMADLVVNHCSSESEWFKRFKQDLTPEKDYFISLDADTDVSQIVRPRTNSLLRPTETSSGTQYVWCTFSHDQIDLNFANPDILKEMIKVIAFYLDHGVSIFRLDAIAFLWKELGTSCLNLPQTHEMVRLFRSIIEHRNPKAIIITETNIPNRENLAYFGNSNEAHMIYNFALPPLLLHGLLSGENFYLNNWLMSMPPAQDGTTYFNFIASHDGIGLRPVEGLLDDETIQQITDCMQQFGGKISYRNLSHDQVKPYEINISLFDAFSGTLKGVDQWQIKRFICAHTIMLGLEGVPAFYIHSLLATPNDQDKVTKTQSNRSINRHNWDYNELQDLLSQADSTQHQVLSQLKRIISLRKRQSAFHPNSTQYTLHLGEGIFAYWRQNRKREQSIFCVYNISDQPREIPLSSMNLVATDSWVDILSNKTFNENEQVIHCEPYDCLWITNRVYS